MNFELKLMGLTEETATDISGGPSDTSPNVLLNVTISTPLWSFTQNNNTLGHWDEPTSSTITSDNETRFLKIVTESENTTQYFTIYIPSQQQWEVRSETYMGLGAFGVNLIILVSLIILSPRLLAYIKKFVFTWHWFTYTHTVYKYVQVPNISAICDCCLARSLQPICMSVNIQQLVDSINFDMLMLNGNWIKNTCQVSRTSGTYWNRLVCFQDQ